MYDKECGQECSCKQLRQIPQLSVVGAMGCVHMLHIRGSSHQPEEQSLLRQQCSATSPRHCPDMPCPLHQQERDPSCRAVQCWQDRVQAYISTTETLVREYRDLLGVHMDTEDHQRYHRILAHFKDPNVESILFRRTATNVCVTIKYQEEAKEETKDSKAE